MCFWASLLMISFKGLNLMFFIWLSNTTIEVIVGEKKANLNKSLLLLLGIWPEKYGISILEHYFGPLYHVCTHKEYNHSNYHFLSSHAHHIHYQEE